jgi:threonine/homoserine/homoserine lactone efflux protein
MALHTLVSFLLVSIVATATPGPAVLYVLSSGMSGGLRAFGPASLGILCADALYFALSVAGLGTFLLASYGLFVAVKWAGALYLVWLGCRLLRAAISGAAGPTVDSAATPSQARWLSGGFMVHAANPKALLYFGSIVPQFLRPSEPLLPQIATLGMLHLVTALSVMFCYGLFAAQIRVFARRPWFARTLYGTSGAMLVAAGAGLAAIQRGTE